MDLIKILDEAILKSADDEERPYIGASSIGSGCNRSIWYSFTGAKGLPISAKLRRTFEVGHRLEEMVKDYIELGGFKLIRDGKELFCQDDEIELFQGTCDGLLYLNDINVVVLEIKTAKSSEYKRFVENGLKAWKSKYYAQCQSYMGMKKLSNCLFIVINKDDQDWHSEWIEYDDIYFNELRVKALSISTMTEPPEKINQNPCWWECQMCRFKELCHKPPERKTGEQSE